MILPLHNLYVYALWCSTSSILTYNRSQISLTMRRIYGFMLAHLLMRMLIIQMVRRSFTSSHNFNNKLTLGLGFIYDLTSPFSFCSPLPNVFSFFASFYMSDCKQVGFGTKLLYSGWFIEHKVLTTLNLNNNDLEVHNNYSNYIY